MEVVPFGAAMQSAEKARRELRKMEPLRRKIGEMRSRG